MACSMSTRASRLQTSSVQQCRRRPCQALPAARPLTLSMLERPRGWLPGAASLPRQHIAVRAGRGGLMDTSTPTLPLTTLPNFGLSKENDMLRGPMYKVLLHNDDYNRREYVVKVLLQVVHGISVGDAMESMQVAHETGVAMVTVCPQGDAERYCEGLRLNGLTSTIEPGTTC